MDGLAELAKVIAQYGITPVLVVLLLWQQGRRLVGPPQAEAEAESQKTNGDRRVSLSVLQASLDRTEQGIERVRQDLKTEVYPVLTEHGEKLAALNARCAERHQRGNPEAGA